MLNDILLLRRSVLASVTGAAASSLISSSRSQAVPATVGAHLPLKRVKTSLLDVAYVELGPAVGTPVLLLHGWPYDIHTYGEAASILAGIGYRVLIPYLRGYGETRFLSDTAPRNGQQAALATDAMEFVDALGLDQFIVGGCDWGARTACILAATRPERVRALVSVSGYLISSQAANEQPLKPEGERNWWYQFYFATERGRQGYALNTEAFAHLIWKTASPRWRFANSVFARSATALANPDHVAITVHNYRWRLGLAEGERRYDALEATLAAFPEIRVPTITLEGDANGAPHPLPADYRHRFTGRYEHRQIDGGIGHNLPQEAPQAFAKAIIDANRMTGS
jgi:pimeloyl-ACP methyl ester carboxylesterase